MADRILARSPADAVKVRKAERTLITPLTIGEVKSIADAIRPDLYAAVVLAATTGLRQGELFGLTEDRVQWLRRKLVIDRQLITPNKGKPRFGPVKSGRSNRTVTVTDEAMADLSQHVERFGLGGPERFLFHNEAGSPLSKATAYQAFRGAAKRADINTAGGWHLLRHHAASTLIRESQPVTAVAKELGHSPAVCLKIYANWWPDQDEQIRAAMSAAWKRDSDAVADQSRTRRP